VLPAGQLIVPEIPMRQTVQVVALFSLWLTLPTKAQVVGADGSIGYSYSFPLPSARGRYQPSLSISYNSNAGMSAVGFGWSLSDNYVEVSSRATPNLTGQPRQRYFLALNGTKQLIVPASDQSYRVDIGDSYFKLTRNTTANTWTAVDGVGNSYTYSCAPGEPFCTRWYLVQVSDVDGNNTTFAYNALELQECRDPSGADIGKRTAALLTSIAYNYKSPSTAIHSVNLGYTAHPPSGPQRDVEAIGECLVTHDHLLSSVQITRAQPAGGTVTLASYDLVTRTSDDTGHWLVDRIQRRDRMGGYHDDARQRQTSQLCLLVAGTLA